MPEVANGSVIGTMCVIAGVGAQTVASSLAQLQSVSPGGCSSQDIIQGSSGCQNGANRLCEAMGYSTGFNISDFDGNQQIGLVCTYSSSVQTEVTYNGEYGFERPAVIGQRLMGGPNQSGSADAKTRLVLRCRVFREGRRTYYRVQIIGFRRRFIRLFGASRFMTVKSPVLLSQLFESRSRAELILPLTNFKFAEAVILNLSTLG